VGYLIHQRCSFQYDLLSNKERSINFTYPHEDSKITPSHKFSRDVLELHLFTTDRMKPFMIFLSTHLKSPLDPEGIDPGGTLRRKAELNALVDIYKSYVATTLPVPPVIVVGDFNGNASRINTDPEFQYLYQKTDLLDVLELENIPMDQRATFYHVRSGGRIDGKQIDFVFLSKSAQKNLKPGSSRVCRYKNDLHQKNIVPSTIDEKLDLPSDHYPIVFTLQINPRA
jgi:endonuclease/exonuclease/phosphatase family metal-dependent hydrolase